MPSATLISTTALWEQAVNRAQSHLAAQGLDTTFTLDDAVALGIPRTQAVIVLAMLVDIGFLHHTHHEGLYARRPDLPALGAQGHVWRVLYTPCGDQVQIFGDRPPREVSRLRVPVKWLCTACAFIAPSALRLPSTTERAFSHLLRCPARRPLAVSA
ncbi:hypothetical protein AB0M58_14340 [Streptomyces bobili]|uniref:hypothetical protein n=1 Tax=Streptomyces bobili TaxID=67280 RepID=UPI00343B86A1